MTLRVHARHWVLLVVCAQALVLAWMAAEREWILRTGQVVHLRTAPVDPRDPFRGDFVRLQYDINNVSLDERDPVVPVSDRARRRHELVYTRLEPAGEGVFDAAGAGRTSPAGGLFIRGRTEDAWFLPGRGGGQDAVVKYGIEQLFVEQGRGGAIEERRGAREGVQVPMEVEVAIGGSGTAVIRGYRWSRLGVKFEMLRQATPRDRNADRLAAPALEGPELPLSPKVRITLVNASDTPLAVADPGEHCGFHLVAAGWGTPDYAPDERPCAAADAAANTITLSPSGTYSVDLDLSETRWHVLKDGQPVEIGALPGPARFRLEYRAPGAGVANPALWRGRLASAAFTASGVVD
jgi:uncharacterized membrane-anchored protein